MTLSDLSRSQHFQRQVTQKWYKIAILKWQTDKKSYIIHQTVPFWITLNDPNPDCFKFTSLFDAEYLRNSTRQRHS